MGNFKPRHRVLDAVRDHRLAPRSKKKRDCAFRLIPMPVTSVSPACPSRARASRRPHSVICLSSFNHQGIPDSPDRTLDHRHRINVGMLPKHGPSPHKSARLNWECPPTRVPRLQIEQYGDVHQTRGVGTAACQDGTLVGGVVPPPSVETSSALGPW
jgi:hypothetical protein